MKINGREVSPEDVKKHEQQRQKIKLHIIERKFSDLMKRNPNLEKKIENM